MLQLDILFPYTLTKIIKQHFLQCFLIKILPCNHLGGIRGHLYFENYPYGCFDAFSEMDCTIYAPVGRHFIILTIESLLQEIHEIPFELFFSVYIFNLLIKCLQLFFENIEGLFLDNCLPACSGKRFGYREIGHFYGIIFVGMIVLSMNETNVVMWQR